MQIRPQEFMTLTDNYVVRTKLPPEEVTEEMVAERARQQNLSCGDHVLVQCFDHYGKQLIAEANFVIIHREDEFKSIPEGDRVIRQGNHVTMIARIKDDWWLAEDTIPQDIQEGKKKK